MVNYRLTEDFTLNYNINGGLFPDYVSELFTELLKRVEGKRTPRSDPQTPEPPAPLCSSFDRPDKDEAVTKYQSRFSLS